MLCTDELNAKLLCRQHEEAIANLTAENEKYDKIKAAITQFVDDPNIDSYGIRALKRQLEDYILVIDAIKSANDIDIQEYTSANAIIGDEYLFGRVVTLRSKRRLLKKISDEKASFYRGLYNASRNSLTGADEYYREMAEHYENESAFHQSIIDECTRIIDKYDGIENSTYAMLQQASQYRGLIIDALLTMGQAFDGENYSSCISDYWRGSLSLETALNLDGVLEELVELGVTDDQIENMKEKGFCLDEILFYVKSCTNEESRDFMNKIMSREYDAAFSSVNPDDIDDIAYYFATDYAVHMIHVNDKNQYVLQHGDPKNLDEMKEFCELEIYCNAILNSFGQTTIDEFSGTIIPKPYRDKYLNCLTDKAYEMMLLQADTVSEMRPIDPGFKEQMAEYYRTRAILNLFSTEKSLYNIYIDKSCEAGAIMAQDVITRESAVFSMSISNLNFGIESNGSLLEGVFSFDATHQARFPAGEYCDHLEVTTLYYPDNMQKEADWVALKDAEVYKETAGARMAENTFVGVTMTALGSFSPEFAVGLSFLRILGTRGGQLYGNYDSLAGQEALEVTGDIITGLYDIHDSSKNLEKLDHQVYSKTFTGGAWVEPTDESDCFSIDDKSIVAYDVYTPGELHVIKEWQENGMENWVTFDINPDTGQEYTTNEVLTLCRENCSDTEVLNMCETILLGSDTIMQDISEGGMKTYNEATDLIEKYGRISDNTINSQYEALAKKFDAGIDVGF